MRLQDRLNQRKTNFESSAPQEAVKIMHSATDALVQSEILEQALKKGQTAPAFSLPGPDGKDLSSRDLLKKGPLVIQFFRGGW